jgi:hypothetical protein
MGATLPTLNPELFIVLKRLRLGRIADSLPERLVLAEKQDMALDDLLLLVLSDEVSRRDGAAAGVRARDAGLDPTMRLELWDKTAKVTFEKRMLAELTSLRFLETHRHVIVLGPVGVGKTFISQALGHLVQHFHRDDGFLAVHWARDVFHGGDGDTLHHQPDRRRAIGPGGHLVAQESVEAQSAAGADLAQGQRGTDGCRGRGRTRSWNRNG